MVAFRTPISKSRLSHPGFQSLPRAKVPTGRREMTRSNSQYKVTINLLHRAKKPVNQTSSNSVTVTVIYVQSRLT
jgi:hypothetical protein